MLFWQRGSHSSVKKFFHILSMLPVKFTGWLHSLKVRFSLSFVIARSWTLSLNQMLNRISMFYYLSLHVFGIKATSLSLIGLSQVCETASTQSWLWVLNFKFAWRSIQEPIPSCVFNYLFGLDHFLWWINWLFRISNIIDASCWT